MTNIFSEKPPKTSGRVWGRILPIASLELVSAPKEEEEEEEEGGGL